MILALLFTAFAPEVAARTPMRADESEEVNAGPLRLRRDPDGEPTALETPIISCRSQSSVTSPVSVDLISVIHLADARYYEKINLLLQGYDAVLFEGVTGTPRDVVSQSPSQPGSRRTSSGGSIDPAGAVVEPGDEVHITTLHGGELPEYGDGAQLPEDVFAFSMTVRSAQMGLTRFLGLEDQGDHIDYTRPNMIHADLTMDELARLMEGRNESFSGYFKQLVDAAVDSDSKGDLDTFSAMDLVIDMFATDRSRRFKVNFAQALDKVHRLGLIEQTQNTALLAGRNQRVMSVLSRVIEKGASNIGILYGGGHMSDIEARLKRDMNVVRSGVQWRVAWDLAPVQ